MDICVITNDALVARFIVLELAEAGYSAMHSEVPTSALLNIFDLDFCTEVPYECIGFSYDETKRENVQAFLPRPIDTERLRASVAKRLSPHTVQKRNAILEVNTATRKVKSEDGEIRLSEKEFALFEKLCRTNTLTREEGAKLFDESEGNIVDVYVHYLRKKLSKICDGETVRSQRKKGYSLNDSVTVKFI